MKILIVDTSSTIRCALTNVLTSIFTDEVQFFEADNGQIALDILNINKDITLILLDFDMPVMNGEEFLSLVRSDKTFNTVRIIMCTTESQKSTVIPILKKGVSGYIVKPFTPDMVRKVILPLVSRLGHTLAALEDMKQYNIVNTHCRRIQKILIIEDSPFLSNAFKTNIDEYCQLNCDVAYTEEQAKTLIRTQEYDLILCDIYLPDSSGNFIGELIRNDLRIIIITSSEDEELRLKLSSLPIVDYFLKKEMKTLIDHLVKTVRRLNDNHNTLLGICDDSKLSRHLIAELAKSQNLPYIEFQNGEEAYDYIIKNNHKIDVLITDYEMPKMNGIELIEQIRHEFLSDQLPILALSGSEKMSLTVQILKAGANDYIKKPFANEELYTRLNLTLDQLYTHRRNIVLRKELEKNATQDYLTKLYNRNFFFSQIHHITSDAIRQNKAYGILMIDIDHFKAVNDTYGHSAGDKAIQKVAEILKQTARDSDYCFRWGGEEFLVLITHTTSTEIARLGERLRIAVETSTITFDNQTHSFNISISVGAAVGLDDTPDAIIAMADKMLYQAKNTGRNKVIINS